MSPPLRTLALCAGVGGLELGLRQVLRTRVVGWVERMPDLTLSPRFVEWLMGLPPGWTETPRDA